MLQYIAGTSFWQPDINDEGEFSGFYICKEKVAIYELIGHAKSENTLSVEKKNMGD